MTMTDILRYRHYPAFAIMPCNFSPVGLFPMQGTANIALRAAREACELIVQANDRLDRVKVFEKADNDFVTNIDREVEHLLIEHIKKAFPGHSFLGEESGLTEGEDPDSLWVIDPIDGTRNFMLGFPYFCISIAFIHKKRIQHAVIIDPLRNDEFTASRGSGAKLNGNRIRVGNKSALDKATISLSSAGEKHHEKLLQLQSNLMGKTGGFRITGSCALDMANVAAGRLDAGWVSGIRSWDVAAGILLLEEAGGFISDSAGNPDCLDSESLVFGNARCFRALLKLVP